jgi:hypothetical protein
VARAITGKHERVGHRKKEEQAVRQEEERCVEEEGRHHWIHGSTVIITVSNITPVIFFRDTFIF